MVSRPKPTKPETVPPKELQSVSNEAIPETSDPRNTAEIQQHEQRDRSAPSETVAPHAPPTPQSSSSSIVGVHYRVGKKLREYSNALGFEGTDILHNQQVEIKFVCLAFVTYQYPAHSLTGTT
jgi:hypothetical protein